MTRLVLVPSPFVAAVCWQAVAERLADGVAADYGVVSPPDWYERVARIVADAGAGRGPWVAVLHSGAGGFAPAIAQTAIAQAAGLAGFIFVDAVWPYPGKTCLETAPVALADRLRDLTNDDGLLAPWSAWFDADPLPRLIPDPEARAALTSSLPRVPFAFLEARSPPSEAWAELPSAYLQLSRNYDGVATRAEQRGWIVHRVRMHHLAMASDPEVVAGLLDELARQTVT